MSSRPVRLPEAHGGQRSVNLPGIASIVRPYASRLEAHKRTASSLLLDTHEFMIHSTFLGDLAALAKSIPEGGVRGRVVVDENA